MRRLSFRKLLLCSTIVSLPVASASSAERKVSFEKAYLACVNADYARISSYTKSGSATAQTPQKRENHIARCSALKRFSEDGNPAAQYRYASFLMGTKPTDYEKREIVGLFESAARAGYLPAIRTIARYSKRGHGDYYKKDLVRRGELLQRAASFGHRQDLTEWLMFLRKEAASSADKEKAIEKKIRRIKKLQLDAYNMEKQEFLAKSGSLRAQRLLGHEHYRSAARAYSRLAGDEPIEKTGEKQYLAKKYYFSAAKWLTLASNNPENTQSMYDSTWALIALDKLDEKEKEEVTLFASSFKPMQMENRESSQTNVEP